MSVDDKPLPAMPPPGTTPSGEPSGDKYDTPSGGYFSGGNKYAGKGGGRGSFPFIFFKIVSKEGHWHWYLKFAYKPEWGTDYSAIVYYIPIFVSWDDLSDEQKEAMYNKAIIVWEVENDSTSEKRITEHYKLIDPAYQDGYYFVRVKKNGKLGRPSCCIGFPSDAAFIIPDKIKNFQIEETYYYSSPYTNPISAVSIAYSPPDIKKGFYGIKLYIQGYKGDNDIRELTTRKYNVANGEDDIFNIFLESDADVIMEQKLVGSVDQYQNINEENWNTYMTSPYRAFKVEKEIVDGTYTDTLILTMQRWVAGIPEGHWEDADPDQVYYLDKKVNIGDTILLTSHGSGENYYTIEAVIMAFDKTYPHRKVKARLKGFAQDNPIAFETGGPYVWWKIETSCKFYMVAINQYGYHGALETDALWDYQALDGLPSAPLRPRGIKAVQGENQNVIRWYYSSSQSSIFHIKCFNIYRRIAYYTTWTKLISIPAKNTNFNPNEDDYYEYIDSDMDVFYDDSQMADYDTGLMYAVSSEDKNGMESLLAIADHYLMNGEWSDYIPFRRGTGRDHGVITVVRNSAYNILYNSEANWDYYYGTMKGYGNAHYNDWAIWDQVYAHPARDLHWDNSNKRFYLQFSLASDALQWFRIITQQDGTYTPTEGTIYYASTLDGGLGRTKLIIPSIQYTMHISQIMKNGTYLYLYPDITEYPPFTADPVYNNAQYFISIAPFSGSGSSLTIWKINQGYPFFRNGWLYYHSNQLNPNWNNGYFHIKAITSSYGRCAYSQRIRPTKFYPGMAITCSFNIKRTGLAVGTNFGLLGFSIENFTEDIYSTFDTSPAVPFDTGAYIELKEIPLDWEYIVLYSVIPNPPSGATWANVNYVKFSLVAQWQSGDTKTDYLITMPMVNIGNEAAPYNPNNYPIRILGHSNPIPENPGNLDEEDPMCIEENQRITMPDGTKLYPENLIEGLIIKGLEYNCIIEKISSSIRECVEIEMVDGNFIIVSTTHLIFYGEDKYSLRLTQAKKLIKNMKLYNAKKDKMVAIKDIKNVGTRKVYKITTNYPHHIIVNDILTHNMKKGWGK